MRGADPSSITGIDDIRELLLDPIKSDVEIQLGERLLDVLDTVVDAVDRREAANPQIGDERDQRDQHQCEGGPGSPCGVSGM